jgi:glycine/D-amino acid oxidase-like deaminating enzyme
MPDVVVIGAGIAGCAAAALLAEAGTDVLVVDRVGVGHGASGRNSGIVELPDDDAFLPLHQRSIARYEELGGDLGAPPADQLYLSFDPELASEKCADLRRRRPWSGCEVVAGTALRELEPGLAAGLTGCLVSGSARPVSPDAATRAWWTRARTAGATFRLGLPGEVAVRGGRATGVVVGGGLVTAGVVVVAAGVWAPEVVDPSGSWRPVHPVWGVTADVGGVAPRAVPKELTRAPAGAGDERLFTLVRRSR